MRDSLNLDNKRIRRNTQVYKFARVVSLGKSDKRCEPLSNLKNVHSLELSQNHICDEQIFSVFADHPNKELEIKLSGFLG
jgi:hypothetical protein